MAGSSSCSMHLALWATLLFSVLLGWGGAAAFNVTYLQGCDVSNNLTQLWLNGTGLRGPIPPEIGKCTALQVLSLSNNSRVNGSIPPEIGQLTNLRTLDLGSTGLSGPIPSEIGNCTALQVLTLRSAYKVNGSIPGQIGQLTNLTTLDLGSTSLTGPIPEEIGNLPSLQALELAFSSVGGFIPWDALCSKTNLSLLLLNSTEVEGPITRDIGKCTALKYLSLTGNTKVNGSIPVEIDQLGKLTKLDLSGTNLSGPIPSAFGNVSSLEVLFLNDNNLTAPVPWEALCQLAKLYSLNLGGNSQLKGPPPPPCVWSLTRLRSLALTDSPVFGGTPLPLDFCQLVKLEFLYLGSTNLSGTIPPCLGNMPGLRALGLSANRLVGPIPSELGSLRNLTLATLKDNNLTGNIPEEFSDLAQLVWLNIANNQLSGPLPAKVFEGLRQLISLDLSNNSLTGPIPTEIGASGEAFDFLSLAHNNLSAVIPPGLGNLSNLTYLDLSYNQLSGELPVELRALRPSKLGHINLRHNNLTGGVGPIGHLTALSVIALDNNNFSGPIPTAWFNSTELGTLILSFNSFSGPIPSAIRNMRPPNIAEVLALFTGVPASQFSLVEEIFGSITISLDSNQLSGSFPDIGQINVTAIIFNASDNKLSGTFRAGPFKKKNFTASYLELSNNGPLELLPGYNLSGWELVSLPNISSQGDPLVAPDMRALTIAGRGIPPSKKLDLARIPATCPYVSYANGNVNDISFWDACDKSFGCVVNLIGTGSKLSRATRERVCLGKISVFLEGDSPRVQFTASGGTGSAFLVNRQGSVYFNDSAFVNKLDLGPGGVTYTGVDFPRVQRGNLCRNEEAAEVVGITYGVFAALILASAAAWWCARAWGVFDKTGGKLSPRIARGLGAGAYLWGVAGFFVSWGDLVSDVQVVVEIWGVWSAWVILGLILAPFLLSALYAGRVLLEGSDYRWSLSEARFKWIPFYNLPDPTDPLPLSALPLWKYPLVPLALPVTVVYVIILDLLDLLDKIGAHLRFGPTVYSLHAYSEFRSQADLTLRSIPQAVFQTTLYLLGSSRATRIYIDEQILFRSVVLSLLNVFIRFNFLAHEHLTTRVPVGTILQRRFAARNCRATALRALGDDDEKVDEHIFEKIEEL